MRVLAVLLCALPLFADQRPVLRELADFLAIPNLARDTANINANATKLQAMLDQAEESRLKDKIDEMKAFKEIVYRLQARQG